MADQYVERPDIAIAGARSINDQFFPPVVSSIQENYGMEEKTIYIYNVSRLEFNISRPPNHPRFLIRACKEGEKVMLAGTVSHPFREMDYDQNGMKIIKLVDGYREATRILSPQNPGLDQDFTINDPLNVGDNLNEFGCFWSEYGPNDERLLPEIAKALKRMEKTYTKELEILSEIEAQNPQDARARANRISHAAAEYYGVSTSWHRSDLRPKSPVGHIECPNCEEKIASSAAVCRHCNAILDEAKARQFFPQMFAAEKRGPGRPSAA